VKQFTPADLCRSEAATGGDAAANKLPIGMSAGDRDAVGGPPSPAPDVTNAASISGQCMPRGIALRWATMASSELD
jgi:hypothetical protein